MPIRFLDETTTEGKPRIRFLDEPIKPETTETRIRFLDKAQPEAEGGGFLDFVRSPAQAILASPPVRRLGSDVITLAGSPSVGARLAGDAAAGLLSIPAGMAGAYRLAETKLKMDTPVGRGAERTAKALNTFAKAMTPEEQLFIDKLAQSAGSFAAFFVPGLGVARGVTAISRFGPMAVKMAPYIGTSVSSLLEASTEAGQQFMNLIGQVNVKTGKKLMDRQEAAERSEANFWGNILLLAITNRLGLFGGAAGRIRRALASASLEGLQEAGQSLLEDFTAGRPFDVWKAAESAGIGAIIGGGVSLAVPGVVAPVAVEEKSFAEPAATEGVGRTLVEAPEPSVPIQPGIQPQTTLTPTAQIHHHPQETRPGRSELGSKVFPGPQKAFVSSITGHPDYVKLTSDAVSVVNKYAEERGVLPTPEFAEAVFQELHDALGSIGRSSIEERALAKAMLREEYPDLGREFIALSNKRNTEGTRGFFQHAIAGRYGGLRPRVAIEAETPPEPGQSLSLSPGGRNQIRESDVKSNEAAAGRVESYSALERYIIENGGIKANKDIKEEYQQVPVHLRGVTPSDEMETEARRAGVLGANEDFFKAISNFKRKGPVPRIRDFMDEARRQLEHERGIYEPPRELLSETTGMEPAPFEKGPGYGNRLKKSVLEIGENHSTDLKEYTDRVYHETNRSGLGSLYQNKEDGGVFLSNTPDLALGQTGKGILLEFDAEGIFGQVNRQKPAWSAAWKSGAAEFLTSPQRNTPLMGNLRSMTFKKNALSSFDVESYVKKGWTKEILNDGRIRLNAGEPILFEKGPGYGKSQTEMPEFKRWFGASKIVDEGGKPLVVYHGTEKDFSTFEKSKIGSFTGAQTNAFWFTDSEYAARYYSSGERPSMAVFLSASNPLIVTSDQYYAGHKSPGAWASAAIDAGHDGLVIRDIKDGDSYSTVYAVFEPTQIKSATGNRGTFDPNDPSIVSEKQPGLFGGTEPITKKPPKPGVPGQMSLFGQKAQPKFDIPETAFHVKQEPAQKQGEQLALDDEAHAVPRAPVPVAIQESVIVEELQDVGTLPVPKMKIESPEDTAAIFYFLKDETVESFHVVSLDAENNIIGAQMISLGTLNQSIVHPREALKGAFAMRAAKIVAVHNHPSHDPTPSEEDMVLTGRLIEAAKSAGIEFVHHVVINDKMFGLIMPDGKFSGLRSLAESRPAGLKVQLVRPKQTWIAGDRESITSPMDAAQFVRALQKTPEGAIVIALDIRNKPVSVWHLGARYPENVGTLVDVVGKIAMRNNAAHVILSSKEMPTERYIQEAQEKLDKIWGIELLDATAFKTPYDNVQSAKESGVLEAGPDYGPLDPKDLEAKSRENRRRAIQEARQSRLLKKSSGKPFEAGYLAIGDMPYVAGLVRKYFTTTRGVGPVIDRMNDKRLGKIMATIFEAPLTGRKLNAYFKENPSEQLREAVYNAMTGKLSMEALPDDIRRIVKKMRANVDALSRLVAEYGTDSESLKAIIESNIGRYLGRHYKLFEAKRFRPSPEVIKKAKAKLRELHPRTIGALTEDQLDGLIEKILDKKHGTFYRGERPIIIPQGHFIKRKNIPKEIRDLYGEITDPVWLYLKTISDAAVIAHNGQFIGKIAGIPDLFFSKPTRTHFKQLPATKRWGRAAGKYTTPEMNEFLVGVIDPIQSGLYRLVEKFIVNPFKATKTVYSIPSHPRNFLGNTMFSILAENSILNPVNLPYYAKAFKAILTKRGAGLEFWKELLENRVIGQQYWGSEMPRLLKELIMDPVSYPDKILQGVKRGLNWFGDRYNDEDGIYRIATYLKYKAKGMSGEAAADKLDKYFTNYEKLPKAAQLARKAALFGPFMSFKSNVVKIIYNTAREGGREAAKGNPTRLVILAFALSVPALIRKAMMEAFDVDDEEMNKLEQVLPSYRRHGSLVPYRDSNGKLKVFDLTYLWPTGDFERAIRSALAGDAESLNEALDLFAHPVFDAYSIAFENVDPYRKKAISNPNDPLVRKIKDRTAAFLRAIYLPVSSPIPDVRAAAQGRLEPGLLTGHQIVTLINAYNGVADKYGQVKSLPEELKNFATGIRTWDLRPDILVHNYKIMKRWEAEDEKRAFRKWMRDNQNANTEQRNGRIEDFKRRLGKIKADIEMAKKINVSVLQRGKAE